MSQTSSGVGPATSVIEEEEIGGGRREAGQTATPFNSFA